MAAKHLVAAGELLDEDPEQAVAHAWAARRVAPRLGVVREACAIAAYTAGQYERALGEFRAARRTTGSDRWLAAMADCERGLGRPERALDLIGGHAAAARDPAEASELRMVEAGARRDRGEVASALALLDVPELASTEGAAWVARLRYAYADTLEEAGRTGDAAAWFGRALEVDVDEETDAAERLDRLRSGGS